jgi:hypothetical protein
MPGVVLFVLVFIAIFVTQFLWRTCLDNGHRLDGLLETWFAVLSKGIVTFYFIVKEFYSDIHSIYHNRL